MLRCGAVIEQLAEDLKVELGQLISLQREADYAL